jgi:hypothetical protein
MTNPKPLDLDALQALCDAALREHPRLMERSTCGEWSFKDMRGSLAFVQCENVARFWAACLEQVPALIAHAQKLETDVATMVGVHKANQDDASFLRYRVRELEAEVKRLRHEAEMTCLDPRPDCGCAGCKYADEVNGA